MLIFGHHGQEVGTFDAIAGHACGRPKQSFLPQTCKYHHNYFDELIELLGVALELLGRLCVIVPATFLPIKLLALIYACFPRGVIRNKRITRMRRNFFHSDETGDFDINSLRSR